MKPIVAFLAAASLLPASAWSATGGLIVHRKPACAPVGGNVPVTATLPPALAVSSMRVYFRATGTQDDYFIEMHRDDANSYWAVLPVPSSQTTAVAYRLVERDAQGDQHATDPATIPVSAPCPLTLREEEARSARNLVIRQSQPFQPIVPPGFECTGIVARISSDGQLSAYPACTEAVRAASAGARSLGNPCDGCTPNDLKIGGTGGVSVAPVSPSRPKPGSPCEGCTPDDGTLKVGGHGGVSVTPTPPPSRPKPN